MKKKIIALFLIICMAFSPLAMAQEIQSAAENEAVVEEYSAEMQKYIIKLYAKTLAANYYYGVDDEELLYAVICNMIENGKLDLNSAIEAMVETLGDEYAEFYSPEEYAALLEDVSGEFSGIGVTFSETEEGVVVLSVIEDGPAYKAGMMPYDYIVEVDGVDVRGKSSSVIRDYIIGEKGTQVKVTVLRNGKEIELTCIRDVVTVSQIETNMITDKIAHIRLWEFKSNSSDEMKAIVEDLQQKKVKNVILDLRNNPGGDIQAAIGLANIFISAGDIAEIRYKNSAYNETIKSTNYNSPRFNLLVLVNENSASASEFLAMAIQSRGAGKVLGVQSHGKGSIQAVNNAIGGAGFKYTIGEFFSFKGQRIHTIGVIPEFVVENEYIPVDTTLFDEIDLDAVLENPYNEKSVLALEQRLKVLGYLEEADSTYDDETRDSIARIQAILGYTITGEAGFYEYLFLKDYNYEDVKVLIDHQLDAAVKYFR